LIGARNAPSRQDDNYLFPFYLDWVSFSLQLFDLDGIALDARAVRIEDRTASRQVKFPTVPGTAQNFPLSSVTNFSRPLGYSKADGPPQTQLSTLVGAAIAYCVEPPADIEHTNRSTTDSKNQPFSRGNVGDLRYYVSSHSINSPTWAG